MSDESNPTTGESLGDADLEGIGERTALRFASAGITTVEQLAELDADRAVERLGPHFDRWRAETLRAHVVEWIAAARSHVGAIPNRPRSHVFLLTLWTDDEGKPARSRFEHRNPDEPTSEETAHELVGWSPLAFIDFVEREARLHDATTLAPVPRPERELVEWSRHRLSGDLVRGDDSTITMRVQMPDVAERGDESTTFRWRAAAWLRPLAGGEVIDLGRLHGAADPGEIVEAEFPVRVALPTLHRAWFDLALDPPSDADLELVEEVPAAV